MVAPLVVVFLTLMGFVSLSLQPRRCLKTLSEAVTYTASWWRKKGDFRRSKVFPPKFLALLVFMRGLVPNGLFLRRSSSSWRGLIQYHANILSNSNDFIGFFQHPTTPAHEVQFGYHLNSSRWMGSASSFGSTRWIDGNVRNPKFEQGPRYYVFSNGNSDCNLYFYFAQIAQLYGIFSYI